MNSSRLATVLKKVLCGAQIYALWNWLRLVLLQLEKTNFSIADQHQHTFCKWVDIQQMNCVLIIFENQIIDLISTKAIIIIFFFVLVLSFINELLLINVGLIILIFWWVKLVIYRKLNYMNTFGDGKNCKLLLL